MKRTNLMDATARCKLIKVKIELTRFFYHPPPQTPSVTFGWGGQNPLPKSRLNRRSDPSVLHETVGKKQHDAAPHKLYPIRADTEYNFYKLYYLMDPTARWQCHAELLWNFLKKIEVF